MRETEPTPKDIAAFKLEVELELFAQKLRKSQVEIPRDIGELLNKHFWDSIGEEQEVPLSKNDPGQQVGMNFIIEMPVLYASVMVSVGQGNDELIECLRPRMTDRDLDIVCNNGSLDFSDLTKGEVMGTCIVLEGGLTLVRFAGPIQGHYMIGAMAHEYVHAGSYLMHNKGLTRCPETEELLCYIVQYLCEETMKRFGESQVTPTGGATEG